MMAAVAAAPAHAEVGLVGYFQFEVFGTEEKPGFGNIEATGVNHSGTGGAAPGDAYFTGNLGTRWYSALGSPKGAFPGRGDLAVDQATGDLYYAAEERTAAGDFLLAHNFDVVAEGPDDSNVDAKQKVKVIATGGTFTLSCCFNNGAPVVTPPLPYNASAAEVEAAVDQMVAIGTGDSSNGVTVTGGPGGPSGANPYLITFDSGEITGDEFETLGTGGGQLTGPFHQISVETIQSGGAVEICKPIDVCQNGSSFSHTVGGAVQGPQGVALAPQGAPNAGNVLVMEGGFSNKRVSEFTPGGAFVRAFGWDVNAHGPNDGTTNEEQKVTVSATGGKFSLTFPFRTESTFGEPPRATTGATGHGDLQSGSTTVNNVSAASGEFAVGEIITGPNIPAGTTIEGVGAGTLLLSAAPTGTALGAELRGSDIDYNAPASQVESALNALASIGGEGGSVSVSGPNGGPYMITFGGTLGGDNALTLGSSTVALTGSTSISTIANGGSFEVCVEATGDVCKAGASGTKLGQFRGTNTGIAEDSSGNVYVVNAGNSQFEDSPANWVQKFTPSGSTFIPALFGQDEVQKVTVNANAGNFRLSLGSSLETTTGTANVTRESNVLTNVVTNVGHFEVGERIRESTGGNNFYIPKNTVITAVGPSSITMSKPARQNLIGLNIRADTPYETSELPFNASAAQLESSLNALPPVGGEGGSVSVSGGPGGTAPYTVTFNGGRVQATDEPQMNERPTLTPLSGGSGPGANQATVVTETVGGPRGYSPFSTPIDVAIDDADNVYVAKAFSINAAKCADGSPAPQEVRVVRYNTAAQFQEVTAPCVELRQSFSETSYNLSLDPVNDDLYYSQTFGNVQSGDEAFYGTGAFSFILADTGSLPALTLDPPSNLSSSGVTVSGTVNPNGPASAALHPHATSTRYRIEYRVQGESNWTTYAPDTSVGSGGSPVPYSVGVSGLTPKTTYEIRTVVTKLGFESQFGAPQTITTNGAPPTIDSFTASSVTASSADLEALINPLGTATTYHFDYGKTPDYGQSTPETPVGESLGAVPALDHIAGLEPVVYHFRIVATNSFGATTSTDQTFSFYPESCPNSIVRAQTGSGGLPDCRAYELVSPEDSGAASLTIGGPNSPYASPSRLSFYGFFGSIPGPFNPQNVFGDLYVATRTGTGWTTSYVGIPADQLPRAGGPPNGNIFPRPDAILSSRSMDRILDWDLGTAGLANYTGKDRFGSMAPYMWGADGAPQGRLPTNLEDIPNGGADLREGGFDGDLVPSGDLTHYFFSSANVAFAPGGMTTEDGSVYDNDLEAKTVTIASKLQNGDPIPQEPGDETNDYFNLPAASVNGSHILISATGTGACGLAKCPYGPVNTMPCNTGTNAGISFPGKCPENLPGHLYMRVGGLVTYDVSRGAVVHFDGMTDDGSKVYFTTGEDLTEDNSDNDSSTDLYMWSEATDTVTRVSAGIGSVGNTDACNAAWIAGCGVEVVPSLRGVEPKPTEFGFEEVAVHGGALRLGLSFSNTTDNSIAADTGDIYFYSPEQFVASKGIPGRRNLYAYRAGQIEYVATLDADKPTSRFQVTPDGSRAALITDSRLTTYDNAGHDEMYTFTPESGALICVSCIPSGAPPTHDVFGSSNGLFMTNDGRTFFATEDALLPADTNGLTDVYEYVDGRPRLISSGVANIQKSALGEAGLVGVSADGIDVYFSTYNQLVSNDENGQLLRFYDARSGGGFQQTTSAAPCAAADECHGPPNQTATLPVIGSAAVLGAGGNLQTKAANHRNRKHSRRKRGHRRHRHASSTRGGRR
jgi:hypothetical protein